MLSTLDFIQNKISKYSALYLIHKNLQRNIINVRKRSLRRLCFYTCLSFCSRGEVSRPRPGGGCLPRGCPGPGPGGSLPGGSVQAQAQGCPGPGLGGVQAQVQGVCIPACTEADTPPSRRLLLRMVRILLECILVLSVYNFFWVFKEVSSCKV